MILGHFETAIVENKHYEMLEIPPWKPVGLERSRARHANPAEYFVHSMLARLDFEAFVEY